MWSVGAGAAVVVVALAVTLIYLKTGQYLYSKENLVKCQNFTPEEAKVEVLRSRLKKYDGWDSYQEAIAAAESAHIVFLDDQRQKEDGSWFIPFTQPNSDHVKRYYAMLDCGTLITEYASDLGD
ncbi:hypothetical protein [Erwinia sp.]|uniref:hypothetical protein n=1 Tax=Erwinia citreus TaxID=558 RepID=UPI003C7071C4